jgi:hypothetical protein
MPTEVIITLERLRCLIEDDGIGPSEPYIWSFIMSVDEKFNLSFHTLPLNLARILIKDGIRENQTVNIPQSVGVFRLKFDEITKIDQIVLIVTLLEKDLTSDFAIEDGFQAYNQELKLALSDFNFLSRLKSKIEEDRVEARKELKERVKSKVELAIGTFESLDPDDSISTEDITFESEIKNGIKRIQPQSFLLSFEHKAIIIPDPAIPVGHEITTDSYQIEGKIEIRDIPILPQDECQPQIDLVNLAQRAVNAIEAQIRSLQEKLEEASPIQKPSIIKKIATLEEVNLQNATTKLELAQQALQGCRNSHSVLPG